MKSGVPDEGWEYDEAGRVLHYSVVQPGQGMSVGFPMMLNSPGFSGGAGTRYDLYYAYDEAGNRTQMGFLGGGVTYFTYYAYDARNLLESLTDPLEQTVYYQRDELGREIVKALPNGVTTYHAYDLAGQITAIIHQGPSAVLQSLYYTYDDDGQRTRIEREDGTRIYYSYDLAHRLTGENWLDPSDVHLYAFAYDYDAAGNRLQKTFNGEITYYAYNDLNQLTTELVVDGDTTYRTWTADGEMETKHENAGWTYYTWDVDESLKKIEAPSVTLENKYNSRMQRVWRSEDGDASDLIYDRQKLSAEAGSGGLGRYYLSEEGSVYSPLLAQFNSEHWFLFDAQGTTVGLTNDSGVLGDTFLFEAFGSSLGRTGVTPTAYQYEGQYGYFSECQIVSVWRRWYSMLCARWASADTWASDSSRYVYSAQTPTRYADPRGTQAGAFPPPPPNPWFPADPEHDPNDPGSHWTWPWPQIRLPDDPRETPIFVPPPWWYLEEKRNMHECMHDRDVDECMHDRAHSAQSPCWAHYYSCATDGQFFPGLPGNDCSFYTADRCMEEDVCVCQTRAGSPPRQGTCGNVSPIYPHPRLPDRPLPWPTGPYPWS